MDVAHADATAWLEKASPLTRCHLSLALASAAHGWGTSFGEDWSGFSKLLSSRAGLVINKFE